jgi:hypothetical protein
MSKRMKLWDAETNIYLILLLFLNIYNVKYVLFWLY